MGNKSKMNLLQIIAVPVSFFVSLFKTENIFRIELSKAHDQTNLSSKKNKIFLVT